MERHRSGHNGADSNFFVELAVCSAKKAHKYRVFSGSKIEYFVVLSVSSCEKFFELNGITYTESCPSGRRCSTRNAVSRKASRVRIPNSPPKKSSKLKGLLDFPFLPSFLNLPIFPVRTACFLVENRVQIRFCYLALLGYILPAAPEII